MGRHRSWQNRTKDHRSLRLILAAVAIAACAAGPQAVAQTGYSLRIWTLGTPFAGIIDDPFTDAYMNPARVGDLGGRQVYAGQLPAFGVCGIYPGTASSWELQNVFPPEKLPTTYTLTYSSPYTAGFVSPLGRALTSSFALEAAAEGSDRLDDGGSLDVDVMPVDFFSTRRVNGSEISRYHALFDWAVGTGSPETSGGRFGARATVSYDELKTTGVDHTQRIDTPGASVSEQEYTYGYDSESAHCEQSRLSVVLGRFSRQGFVRDIVCGGALEWQQHELGSAIVDVKDEDYDGNGLNPAGGTPEYNYARADFSSDRDYAGGALFARMGLRWRRNLRSYHEFSWRRLNGDGASRFVRDVVVSEFTADTSSEDCRYGKDGEFVGERCFNSVGYFDEVRDGMLWAVSAQVRYYSDRYDEAGDGSIVVDVREDGDTTTFDVPYRQKHGYELESWVFHLPVSIDWEVHRRFAWRFAVAYQAQRSETAASVEQSIEVTDPDTAPHSSTGDRTQRLNYETEVLFTSGIAVKLWDRVAVDLYGGSSSGVAELLRFVNAVVTYRF